MKTIKRYSNIFISVLVIFILVLAGCGGDGGSDDPIPQPDPQAIATASLIAKTWNVTSVTRDGADAASDFAGFVLDFTVGTYTTENGSLAWDASGNWNWADGTTTSNINLSNGVLLEITLSDNNSTLTIKLNVPETVFDIGRSNSLAGDYVFVMS